MDTHRLKYFLRIAEEGSMTRAASVLGIAQPALSRQIRLLEEDLGVTLFRRTSGALLAFSHLPKRWASMLPFNLRSSIVRIPCFGRPASSGPSAAGWITPGGSSRRRC
jgi:Bacterial regulatory helix-turn-helix protein, lysR family